MKHGPHSEPGSFWRSRYAMAYLVIGAMAAYFLLTEHLAHVVGALPFLLLLAYPLMHVFMHHGHHHGASGAGTEVNKDIQAQFDEEFDRYAAHTPRFFPRF